MSVHSGCPIICMLQVLYINSEQNVGSYAQMLLMHMTKYHVCSNVSFMCTVSSHYVWSFQ